MDEGPDEDKLKIKKEILIVILVGNCQKDNDTWGGHRYGIKKNNK